MAAAYTSRDMVEDYLRYKLLSKGVEWRTPPPPAPPAPRRHSDVPSSPSWRSERGRTSHRGLATDHAHTGEEVYCVVTATAAVLMHTPRATTATASTTNNKPEVVFRGNWTCWFVGGAGAMGAFGITTTENLHKHLPRLIQLLRNCKY